MEEQEIKKLRKKVERNDKMTAFKDDKNPKPPMIMWREFLDVSDKLEDIKEFLDRMANKEEGPINEYYEEIQSVVDAIGELKDSFDGKDMSVNVPLDNLATAIENVEKAIKQIPPVVFPKTSDYTYQIAEISEKISDIQFPEFPVKEIEKLLVEIGKKIDNKKESKDFDYSKIDELIKAVKNIKQGNTIVTQTGPSRVGINNAAGANINPATSENQETLIANQGKLRDENGTFYGVKQISNKPRVSSMPYLYDIAEGNITGHETWTKIGYNADCGGSWEDLWQVGGAYVAPTAEMGLEAISTSAQDAGVIIFSGTSSGGSLTTIVDVTKNFTAGTAVVAGDIVLLDTSGTFGVVTGVTATTLTCAGGFCGGSSGESKAYRILDISAGGTGCKVARIKGLDGNYAEIDEFIVMNGTSAVATTKLNWFRINSWRCIIAGSGLSCAGTVDIRNLADTPIYSRMVAGDTRARNINYCVPAGKTLFVTSITFSAGSAVAGRSTRMVTRATYDPSLNCALPILGLFQPFTEVIVQDTAFNRQLEIPTKLPEKTELKVSVISPDGATYASAALRGWLETN